MSPFEQLSEVEPQIRVVVSFVLSLAAIFGLGSFAYRVGKDSAEDCSSLLHRALLFGIGGGMFQAALIYFGGITIPSLVALANAVFVGVASYRVYAAWSVVILINAYLDPARFGAPVSKKLTWVDIEAMNFVLGGSGPIKGIPPYLNLHDVFTNALDEGEIHASGRTHEDRYGISASHFPNFYERMQELERDSRFDFAALFERAREVSYAIRPTSCWLIVAFSIVGLFATLL